MELGSKGEGVAHVKSGVLSPLTGETNPSQASRTQVCSFALALYVASDALWRDSPRAVVVDEMSFAGSTPQSSRRVESRGKVTAALRGRTW